jgi:hypothetical protein
MNDLNLLPSQAKFQAERMRLKAVINNFLWIFGGVWVLLVIVIFLLELVLNFSLKKFNNDYKKVSTQYQSLAENMVLTQKIKYQAKVVAKVLSDRFEYGKSMKLVKSLFSEKLLIKNMEMTDTKGFQVEGSVEAGEDMNELEDKVNYINSGLVDGVVSAQIKDVSIDTVKGWTFVMEVKLK